MCAKCLPAAISGLGDYTSRCMTNVVLTPSQYLETALSIIEREAVCAVAVAWPTVRESALRLTANATTTADTYGAIELALQALNDNHSFLKRPEQQHGVTSGGFGLKYVHGTIARVYPDSPAYHAGLRVGERVLMVNGTPVGIGVNRELPRHGDATLTLQAHPHSELHTVHLRRAPFGLNRAPQGRLLRKGIAWIDLPDHGGSGTLPDGRLYQDAVQGLIAELRARGARAWLVDLRLNEGGNMYPMLAGIGPIVGSGVLGAFVRDDASWSWAYEDGAASVDGHVLSRVSDAAFPVLDGTVPVAVLLSPLMSSSGEIMAISFKGRPNTRFFGEPTQGLTTANSPYPLADGAELWLATSYEADRTGRVYREQVQPDVEVLTTWSHYLSDSDAVLHVAQAWLSEQTQL